MGGNFLLFFFCLLQLWKEIEMTFPSRQIWGMNFEIGTFSGGYGRLREIPKKNRCGISMESLQLHILQTLGRRIIEGKAKWGDAIQFAGEFRYIKGFWEWTEDILSRCKQKLVAAQELDGVDETRRRFVPRSCKFLLHAYHLLQRNNDGDQFPQVPADKWIKFWFKRATKYCEPPRAKRKKAVCPKSTHNPSGTFGVHGKWSSTEESLFSKLGIEGSLKDETFLAAYLACWLCTFALPTDGVGLIRPSTFKVASIMAAGRRVGLIVPVLASIYEDDGCAKDFEEAYFIAIRSNYLPLRQGDHFDVEPCSAHRLVANLDFFKKCPGFYHKMFAGRLWKMEFAIGVYAFHLRPWKMYGFLQCPKCKEVFFRGVQRMVDRDSQCFS
ncbi:UNVERIFIED_CONTAM: hypothetical protein Sradi_3304900 [Sesamum radiatum]|uniref:Aminotransferase-like plant mobile domain-containing protein n=1 Tax=Sesamum radiatum TaxID=300843 RepID=A0AAW2R1E4_SESRA